MEMPIGNTQLYIQLSDLWLFSKLLQPIGLLASGKLVLGSWRNHSSFIGLHLTIWPRRGSNDPATDSGGCSSWQSWPNLGNPE